MPTTLFTEEQTPSVHARCAPPVGWKPEPLKTSPQHTHQIWLSPSGHTAYGVIHFDLPLPIGSETVLYFFIREMNSREGPAELLGKMWDAKHETLFYVARSVEHTFYGAMTVRGFQGWIVYAGTYTNLPVEPAELRLAQQARERTLLDP